MDSSYDAWKLAGPPEADQEELTDIICDRCDWEGDVACFIAGNNVTWECPGCEHEHHEDATDRFGPDPDYAHDNR